MTFVVRRVRLLIILCSILLVATFLRASKSAALESPKNTHEIANTTNNDRPENMANNDHAHIVVLPHFMLAKEQVAHTYEAIANAYIQKNITPKYIVIISPNHFSLGSKHAETIDPGFKTLCYKSVCVPLASRSPAIGRGTGTGGLFFSRSPQNSTSSSTSSIATTKEHGIGEHIPLIKTYFPQTKIIPFVLNPRSGSAANLAYTELQKIIQRDKDTLVIASVDRSHYVQEPLAALHDRTSLYTIGYASGRSTFAKLEVDCPACLFAVSHLAKDAKLVPRLLRRDSSSLILKHEQLYGNTSRNVLSFVSPTSQTALPEQGFTLTMVGDIIYDRAVKSRLSKPALLTSYFARYFQEGKAINAPETHIHRAFFGSDLVIGNLETPIVSKTSTCLPSHKNPRFCSTPEILPYLKRIGFTHVTRANNHTFDGGREAAQETKIHLSDNGLHGFGLLSYMNGKFEDWTVATGSIRGFSYALIGIDLTLTPTSLLPRYCDTIQSFSKNAHTVIVFPHRGSEYQPIHNAQQQKRAKQLIDCGASAIIGSHPHVPQDIERYNKKPIIYSVGNFLMDQGFSEPTKQGRAATIDFRFDQTKHLQTIIIGTGVVDAYVEKTVSK